MKMGMTMAVEIFLLKEENNVYANQWWWKVDDAKTTSCNNDDYDPTYVMNCQEAELWVKGFLLTASFMLCCLEVMRCPDQCSQFSVTDFQCRPGEKQISFEWDLQNFLQLVLTWLDLT